MLTQEQYWNLLGARIFSGLTEEEKQSMTEFETAFPEEAKAIQALVGPDEELDEEEAFLDDFVSPGPIPELMSMKLTGGVPEASDLKPEKNSSNE